jgi:hypothetical protein
MPTFTFMGLERADMADDRRHFDIQFRTDQGPVTLSVAAERLDGLITTLQGIEYRASLLDPAKGQQAVEAGQLRVEVVDEHRIGSGAVEDKPSVVLGLKSGQVLRFFALDAAQATVLQQSLADEIPKLTGGPANH